MIEETTPPLLRCSFCNKNQRDVKKLIAGPSVQICDKCVDICVDIVAEDRKDAPDIVIEDSPNAHERSQVAPPLAGYFSNFPPGRYTNCSLCRILVPLDDVIVVHSRGALCPGCIGAVEAAIAASRETKET